MNKVSKRKQLRGADLCCGGGARCRERGRILDGGGRTVVAGELARQVGGDDALGEGAQEGDALRAVELDAGAGGHGDLLGGLLRKSSARGGGGGAASRKLASGDRVLGVGKGGTRWAARHLKDAVRAERGAGHERAAGDLATRRQLLSCAHLPWRCPSWRPSPARAGRRGTSWRPFLWVARNDSVERRYAAAMARARGLFSQCRGPD